MVIRKVERANYDRAVDQSNNINNEIQRFAKIPSAARDRWDCNICLSIYGSIIRLRVLMCTFEIYARHAFCSVSDAPGEQNT